MKIEAIADAQPVIVTDRFVLRPLRRSDAGLIAHYTSDWRVVQFTSSIPHPLPPGATEAYIARIIGADSAEDAWVLDGSAHGLSEVLGVISLKRMDRGQSEVGYWIAPAMWNTGLATDALRALLETNPHNDRTIFAAVMQDNPGSARVLTNAGFEYLGDAESFSVARNARVATWTYLKKLA